LGRDREEVTPILPVHRALAEQPHVGLAHDGGRLQTVMAPFAGELTRRDDAKLVVDERHQLMQRIAVARLPLVEEARDGGRTGLGHDARAPVHHPVVGP
jgi:hypothetical protein